MRTRRRPPHLLTGARGERLARWYLRLKGYRILERNYRCRLGEVDIVAVKGKTLVFVEVRSRRSGSLVKPLETVDAVKVHRWMGAARCYLASRAQSGVRCRFDLVAIRSGGPLRSRIRHFKDLISTDSQVAAPARRRAGHLAAERFTPREGWEIRE